MTRAADVEKTKSSEASWSQSNWFVWIAAQFQLSLEFSRFGRLEVVPGRGIRINSTLFSSSKEPLVS